MPDRNGLEISMKLFIILAAIAASAYAQEGETSSWQGSLSAGGLFTSGNTDVSQLDAGLEVTRLLAGPRFRTDLEVSISFGSQEGVAYREKYLGLLGFTYQLTENNYATASGYWTKDEFTGINREYGASAGLGRRLVHSDVFTASMEAGAGFLSRENTQAERLETSTGYTGLEMALLVSDDWKLTEAFRLTVDFQDSDNYSMESVLEASSSITGELSLVTGYDVTFHNLPPVEGNEKTDTALRLQLRLDI